MRVRRRERSVGSALERELRSDVPNVPIVRRTAVVLKFSERLLRSQLADIEDRRRWHPLGSAAMPLTLSGGRAHVVARDVISPAPFYRVTRPSALYFASLDFPNPVRPIKAARKIALCLRRKERREIIWSNYRKDLAHYYSGRGAKPVHPRDHKKSQKRSYWSNVWC